MGKKAKGAAGTATAYGAQSAQPQAGKVGAAQDVEEVEEVGADPSADEPGSEEADVNSPEQELFGLADLMYYKKLRPGVLATAIERHGIYSWDRYGRFTRYGPDTPEAAKALDLVAAEYEYHSRLPPDYTEMSPAEYLVDDPGGDNYVWPASDLPDFKALEESSDPHQRASSPSSAGAAVRQENADLRVAGALLLLITGELDGESHPRYADKKQLVEYIEAKLAGYPGLKENTLRAKLDRARGLLDVSHDWPQRQSKKANGKAVSSAVSPTKKSPSA